MPPSTAPGDDPHTQPSRSTTGDGRETVPRLEGKIALITGGGTGIGRATALLFAREGARVVVAGRRSQPLQDVVNEIRKLGGVATFSRGDVSKADRVEMMVQGAIFNFGGLDILVNSAGQFIEGTVLDLDERKWDRLLGANLKGAYLVSRLAIPAMKERGGGSIINIVSITGLVGIPRAAVYCASKGGMIQLTRAMAIDHAADNIRVNAVCPGGIDSPMTRAEDGKPTWLAEAGPVPAGEPGTPEDVARVALFLASDESRSIRGAVLNVDGGALAS